MGVWVGVDDDVLCWRMANAMTPAPWSHAALGKPRLEPLISVNSSSLSSRQSSLPWLGLKNPLPQAPPPAQRAAGERPREGADGARATRGDDDESVDAGEQSGE